MSERASAVVAAEVLAAYDAGRDWPGSPLCETTLAEGERLIVWRHGMRDGVGRFRFIRRIGVGKVFAEVEVSWAALRDQPAAMLEMAHRQALWQTDTLLRASGGQEEPHGE